jgi:hypothetical protein
MATSKETIGYLPGQDLGDIAVTREYQEALRTMLDSLDARKNQMFDPQMLALAEGFLKPTQTGSFGESLGYAVAGARQAGELEAKRARELAEARLGLAGQQVGIQRQKARERMFQQAMGEPTSAPAAAGEGEGAPPSAAGATAPSGGSVGASDVAAGVAQQGAGRLTGGIQLAPPDKSFPTYQQFMAQQRNDSSVSLAEATKRWQDLQSKRTEVREGGVFDRASGMFYPTPKADTVERQIAGQTYKVPSTWALQYDSADPRTRRMMEQQFLSGGAEAGAEPGAAPGAVGPKSESQQAVEKIQRETRAQELAKTAAQREAEAMPKLETAMRLDQVTRRLMNYVSQSKQAFGIFQRPDWMSAIGGLINDGIAAGQTRVAMGGFEDFVRKNLDGIKQADLDNISRAVGDFAELELQFRRLYLTGQGAVSNMEAEVVRRVPGTVSDSPQSLMTKIKLLQMRAQHERKVGETWREMKRQNRDLSYLDFEISPVYETMLKQYDDALKAEFDQPARPTGAAQPTGTKRQPGPATRQPAPPGYGNARRRVDQFLGD